MMRKQVSWYLFAFLAVVIGLYPVLYFILDREFGLLSSKSKALLNSQLWNAGFYTHIVLGGLALSLGWVQFSARFRARNIRLHRLMGKGYVFSALASAVAGIGIGFFATGGAVAATGFVCLGLIWFFSTFKAYVRIRQKQVERHRVMMIYSYAACFAAVTLRLWLPVLAAITHDFIYAYRIVAWLCWAPNMVAARYLAR